ncbi:MAG: cupin domain-containing protein [Woeseia sp.]
MIKRGSTAIAAIALAIAVGCFGFVLGKHEVSAATVSHPVIMTKLQIEGQIFKDFEPVVETHGADTTYDVEAFLSSDRHFDAGVYRAGKSRYDIQEPYGVDEYMHFIEGGVTLTSSDGTVTKAGPGDSVIIPKEWTGIWETDGYQKIYVIYSPDAPLSE